MNFWNILFRENIWETFYRITDGTPIFEKRSKVGEWHRVVMSKRYWCADPFIIKENDKYYIFCEVMDRKSSRGLLGCAQLNDNGDTEMTPIMDIGCHTSYPNMFKYKRTWYMIPETLARKTIELYKATEFPYKWEKVKVLKDNIGAVDTTFYQKDDKFYVFVYQPHGMENELGIAELKMEDLTLSSITPVCKYINKIGRPGGNVINWKGREIRVTQFGVDHYGQKLVFKEFSMPDVDSKYAEKDIYELDPNKLKIDTNYHLTGTHTYNICDNYEIVDVRYYKYFPSRIYTLLLKKFNLFGYRFDK